jgi:peptide/nickel transport system permease protein
MESSTRVSKEVVTVSPSEDSTATDGGQQSSAPADLFTRTAAEDIERSPRERFQRWFDAYLYAPLAVAWEDNRTRIGAGVILYFILQGTIGVMLVNKPEAFEHDTYLSPFHSNWLTFGDSIFGVSVPFWPVFSAPLGTEVTGKSIFEMIVHATPAMFKMIIAGAVFSVFVAVLIGTLSGFKGGKTDQILMGFTDVVLTIPGLALILVIAAIFPPKNPYLVGLILGIDNWPGLARTIRSQVLSIREESFVEADRVMGASTATILRKDFVSQLMPYISINFASSARRIIFESVGLYFLGILPFTTQNWGVIMNLAFNKSNLSNMSQIHWLVVPMVEIGLLSFGIILFSQGLDRVFNVRLRARHAKKAGGDEDEPAPGPAE